MRHGRSRGIREIAALVAAGLLAATATAQPMPRTTAAPPPAVRLTADEQTLWLMQVDDWRSQIYERGVQEPFAPRTALHGPIVRAISMGGVLFAFVEDGSLYALTEDDWKPGLNLPGRTVPLDLVGIRGELYALYLPPKPEESPTSAATQRTHRLHIVDHPIQRPTVARYDYHEWDEVAEVPAPMTVGTNMRVRPRLCALSDGIGLIWHTADTHRLHIQGLDPEDGTWRATNTIVELPDMTGFWVTSIGRITTLIAAVRTPAGGEELRAYRLIGGAQAGANEWRLADLQLSALPANRHAQEYETGRGFNQHVAMLVLADDGQRYVQFGRLDAAPAEPTVAAKAVLENQRPRGAAPSWLRTLMLVVLGAILAGLMILRRGAMMASIELPPGQACALAWQRLAGCLIDLAPIMLGTALVMGADWRASVRELSAWAMGNDMVTRQLPMANTLQWWALGSAVHCVYCLVFELLTQRTPAKMLLGTRVATESAAAPRVGQIIVRNLFRFLELQPPLWVLGFLVILSRNRQRAGDIFAHTLVMRQVHIEPHDPLDEH